jgi:hypothetical protein
MRDLTKRKIRPQHIVGQLLVAAEKNTLSPTQIQELAANIAADHSNYPAAQSLLRTFYKMSTYLWALSNDVRFHYDGRPLCVFAITKTGKEISSIHLTNPEVLNAKGQVKVKLEWEEERQMKEIVAGLMDPNPGNNDSTDGTNDDAPPDDLDLSLSENSETETPTTEETVLNQEVSNETVTGENTPDTETVVETSPEASGDDIGMSIDSLTVDTETSETEVTDTTSADVSLDEIVSTPVENKKPVKRDRKKAA